MDLIVGLEEAIAGHRVLESHPEAALLLLGLAPVLFLFRPWLPLVLALLAEMAMTVIFLAFGMQPSMMATFLIAGNAAMAATLLMKVRHRSAGLEARLASAEEAIGELRLAEERRRAATARDIVHQFPGSQRGRISLEASEHASRG